GRSHSPIWSRLDYAASHLADGNTLLFGKSADSEEPPVRIRGTPKLGVCPGQKLVSHRHTHDRSGSQPVRLSRAILFCFTPGIGRRRPRVILPGWAKSRNPRPYSINSSARASSDCGTVKPTALAVLRLITSLNLVGCWTGRSAGLAPFRILST